ncbi:hypothetical protein AALB_3056 [Agarivorans albus MKT 106]|uniref:Uncharacterized protein n=1 Tax=Agarivorans albus MKT 106 TaxID=1331007 RepID=R9PTT4_AGAAL|nr:hypothetical protein AALB_3056 [Agarivorans albus MKT 106]
MHAGALELKTYLVFNTYQSELSFCDTNARILPFLGSALLGL